MIFPRVRCLLLSNSRFVFPEGVEKLAEQGKQNESFTKISISNMIVTSIADHVQQLHHLIHA